MGTLFLIEMFLFSTSIKFSTRVIPMQTMLLLPFFFGGKKSSIQLHQEQANSHVQDVLAFKPNSSIRFFKAILIEIHILR